MPGALTFGCGVPAHACHPVRSRCRLLRAIEKGGTGWATTIPGAEDEQRTTCRSSGDRPKRGRPHHHRVNRFDGSGSGRVSAAAGFRPVDRTFRITACARCRSAPTRRSLESGSVPTTPKEHAHGFPARASGSAVWQDPVERWQSCHGAERWRQRCWTHDEPQHHHDARHQPGRPWFPRGAQGGPHSQARAGPE